MEKEINNSNQFKVDNKDKEILRLLNKDARMTSKAIGTQINSSREVTDYRIKRLAKSGLINSYITIINDSVLGFNAYLLLLQLQNYTKEDEERIIKFLGEHPFIKWVLKCGGDFDIQTIIVSRNPKELARIIDEIDSFCGKMLRNYNLALVINLLVPENLDFLLPKKNQELDLPSSKPVPLATIDEKDSLLLKHLSTDGRGSVVKLAQQIGLSADATNKRIRRLKKEGVIKKFQAVVDLSKLNYLLYSVLFKINNYSSQKESQIRTFLQSVPNITFAERIIGEWDLRVQISCETPQQLEEILQKIRQFLGEDLKYYKFMLMIKEFKRVSFTKGMEKS
ncbi:MAG: Lrp/AsnC family transcriptional regulator [Candidatus Woesearchaeota archaeon]